MIALNQDRVPYILRFATFLKLIIEQTEEILSGLNNAMIRRIFNLAEVYVLNNFSKKTSAFVCQEAIAQDKFSLCEIDQELI